MYRLPKAMEKNLMTGKSERPPAGRKQSAPAPQSLPLFSFSFSVFQTLCVTVFIYIYLFFSTFEGLVIFQSTHKGKFITKLGSNEAEAEKTMR